MISNFETTKWFAFPLLCRSPHSVRSTEYGKVQSINPGIHGTICGPIIFTCVQMASSADPSPHSQKNVQ